ncbi:MAG: hypothetical protein GY842_16315 [bacterium]|nr:hypothetical protein [bacterium]
MGDPVQSCRTERTRADLVVLIVAGLICIAFRLHAYPAPLESDECNYAYFAKQMLNGDRLYVDLWDHQPPGIFVLLAGVTSLWGSGPEVYRTFALVLVLGSMFGVFELARRWFNRPAAWTATLLFAIASSDPGIAGEGCNREIHMNALLVASWWLLACGRATIWWRIFVAGLLLGLASVVKTVVAVHWLALTPAVAMLAIREREQDRRAALRGLAAFAAGPAVVWGVVFGYFAIDGRASNLLDSAFVENLAYSGGGHGLPHRLVAFFLQNGAMRGVVFGFAPALWLAGIAGLVAFAWRRDMLRSALLAAWVLGSYMAVCLPGKFWPHYYMLMLPPMVLLAAGLVDRLGECRPALSTAASAVLLLGLSATQLTGYLLVAPERIAHHRYGDRMTWVRDQAQRVAEVTAPEDSIYVWGFDAGFYYYSGRHCATRYTMNTALLGHSKPALARRHTLARDLARSRPRLILIPFSQHHPPAELLGFIQDHKYVSVARTQRMEVLCDLKRPIEVIDWTWPAK